MKIDKKIRDKRIKEIHNLYEMIIDKTDGDKEEMYNVLKSTFDEDKVIAAIYSSLESTLSTVLKEIKRIYKSYDKDIILDLVNLLYSEDEKTLDERVHGWFEKYDKDQILTLFSRLCLILDTESLRIISTTIKEKTKAEYVEIIGDTTNCAHGICDEWADGEVHHEDDVELPPYHPGCQCEAVFYEEEEVEGDL